MDLQGKIIAALPARSGKSQRGDWTAQDFVVETPGSYPRKMVFSVFGQDRLQRFNIQIGQYVNVSFDIDAHEYNGRWYNSVRAYDVRLVDPASVGDNGAAPYVQPQPAAAPQAAAPFPPAQEQDSVDDLPF